MKTHAWLAVLALTLLGCTAEAMQPLVETETETVIEQKKPSCDDPGAIRECRNNESSDQGCWEKKYGDACDDPNGVPGFCGGGCEVVGEVDPNTPICKCNCLCFLPG